MVHKKLRSKDIQVKSYKHGSEDMRTFGLNKYDNKPNYKVKR